MQPVKKYGFTNTDIEWMTEYLKKLRISLPRFLDWLDKELVALL